MDLKKVINKQTEILIESGHIEEKIQSELKKLMDKIIESSFREYSDFGKFLKEKCSKAFNADLSKITVPEQHTKMLAYIMEELEQNMQLHLSEAMKKNIESFFKPLEKNEYKISEIVEMYKDSIMYKFTDDHDMVTESHRITVIVEKAYGEGYYDLYLDPEENKSKYQCDVCLRFNKDGIWHIEKDGATLHETKHAILGPFEKTLFQMFSTKVKIINDEDYIDNLIPDSYD